MFNESQIYTVRKIVANIIVDSNVTFVANWISAKGKVLLSIKEVWSVSDVQIAVASISFTQFNEENKSQIK